VRRACAALNARMARVGSVSTSRSAPTRRRGRGRPRCECRRPGYRSVGLSLSAGAHAQVPRFASAVRTSSTAGGAREDDVVTPAPVASRADRRGIGRLSSRHHRLARASVRGRAACPGRRQDDGLGGGAGAYAPGAQGCASLISSTGIPRLGSGMALRSVPDDRCASPRRSVALAGRAHEDLSPSSSITLALLSHLPSSAVAAPR